MEKDKETWTEQKARIEQEITNHQEGDLEFSCSTGTNKDKQWIEQELAQNEQEISFTSTIDTSVYEIDFDKVNTIEDIKEILKGINFRFTRMVPEFEVMEHLLKRSEL